ncbi:MAG: glutamate 5-kinase [Nitrospirae bacterium]|nr:glutamate 5-kinase [Candidatus Manganitrophaceae bacterium]
MSSHRQDLHKNKRIVIKIGSNVIASHDKGLNEARLSEIAGEMALLRDAGHELLLVSSGAVLCGAEKLGLSELPKSIPMKQAAAAVGQSCLMWAYERLFSAYKFQVAQILLTHDGITNRRRFINARNTLMTLLEHQVLPIINENDTVTVDEIKMGDNDNLAAQVAHLVDASLLIVFSDVDGLYSEDPRLNPAAKQLTLVESVTDEIEAMAGGTNQRGGTGGMLTKVQMARKVAAYGVTTLLLNGLTKGLMQKSFAGEVHGTLFLPETTRRSSRKHWIASSLKPKGALFLDGGAVAAITKNGRSLLPSGIAAVDGDFEVGDALRCLSPERKVVAIGLTNYNASEMMKIKGCRSSQIENLLGYKGADEVIHRDNLVVFNGIV